MCWRETGPIFWAASGVWLYGAPYVAVPLVPSSSVAAVATKSNGSAWLHRDRVICFSSGEENTSARATVSNATTTKAITNSFTMSKS